MNGCPMLVTAPRHSSMATGQLQVGTSFLSFQSITLSRHPSSDNIFVRLTGCCFTLAGLESGFEVAGFFGKTVCSFEPPKPKNDTDSDSTAAPATSMLLSSSTSTTTRHGARMTEAVPAGLAGRKGGDVESWVDFMFASGNIWPASYGVDYTCR